MKTLAIFLLFVVCLDPSRCTAQGYYYPGQYQGGYYQAPSNTYYQPYANYPPPPYLQQKIIAQPIQAAPLVVTVPIATQAVPIQYYGPTHYYSVQEAYQQRALIREIIREEIRNYLQGVGSTTPMSHPQSQPQSKPATVMPQSSKKVFDLGVDNVTDPQIAQAVVNSWKKATCLNCHSGADNELSGKLRLAYVENGQYALAKQSDERAWKIYGMMSTGMMPPAAVKDASKIAPQDTLVPVLQWVVSGAH